MVKIVSEMAVDSDLLVELETHKELVVKACSIKNDRDTNEDSYAILELPNCLVVMIADGLGGHPHGEYASHEVVENITKALAYFYKQAFLSTDQFETILCSTLNIARTQLTQEPYDNRDTTLTLAAVFPAENLIKVAHVGDCTAALRVDEEKMYIYKQTKSQGAGSFVAHTVGYLDSDHIAYYTWEYTPNNDWKLILHTDGCDTVSTKKGVLLDAPALCTKASVHGKRGHRDNATAISIHFTKTHKTATVEAVDSEAPAS